MNRMRLDTRTRIALALSAAGLLVVSGAAAAGPTSPKPASSSPAPAAAPGPAPAAAPTEAAGEDASVRFRRGLQLFEEGDYTLALVEFERAYQLAPNYKALYNIALVNVQLGRYADAMRTFEQYVHDGGDAVPADRKAQVANTINELKLRTATVEISVNAPGAEITLDNKPIEATRLQAPLLIDAGEHTLRATANGFQPAFRTVTLAGADHVSVRLDLIPVPHGPESHEERGRTVFWPGFVGTGVLAVGAIVSGAVMLDARSRLLNLQNTAGSTQSQRTSAANEQNMAALIADICTGAAIVAGGVSIGLSLRVDHSPKTSGLLVPSQLVFTGSF